MRSCPPAHLNKIEWIRQAAGFYRRYTLADVRLVNAGNSESRTIIKDTQDAASSTGIRLVLLDARTEGDIDVAFKTAAQEHVGALIVGTDPLYYIHRDRLIALAAREALPTVFLA
jgi:putative tryptophan/tyrosine transport system substrate-binding protein